MPEKLPLIGFVEKALDLFRVKTAMSRDMFDLLDAQMKTRAFTVAYIESADQVRKVQDAVDQAITDGSTLAKFRKEVAGVVNGSDWHTETVFRTNVQSAYGAAHWDDAQQLRSLRPYARYSAIMDGRTRPQHAALHGKVYPIDHPFWKTWWPPNDYNCRCHAELLSQYDVEHNKLDVETAMPANITPPNDFTSPAVRGLTLPDSYADMKLGKMSGESLVEVHDRLSEELAFIKSQHMQFGGVDVPVGAYRPGLLPEGYWKPTTHEIPVSWKPAMSTSEARELYSLSKIKQFVYAIGDSASVAEWETSGFTLATTGTSTPYFGEGMYFHVGKPTLPAGKETARAIVGVKNPYVVKWDGAKTSSLTSRRGPLGQALMDELSKNPGMSREEAVTSLLKARGHDGVIYTNTVTKEKFVVVFDKEQATLVKEWSTAKPTMVKAPKAPPTMDQYTVQLSAAQTNALKFIEKCGTAPLDALFGPIGQKVADKLALDIESGEVRIGVARHLRASSASYRDLLENGRFKNQFELADKATSSGCLAPYKEGPRDRWERSLYDKALHKSPAYNGLSGREFLTQELSKERPIYGYLHTDAEYRSNSASQYGNIIFELRADVAKRASYTIGDSSRMQPKQAKGSLTGSLDAIVKNSLSGSISRTSWEGYINGTVPADAMRLSGSKSYIECQILGGVDLKRGDVVRISVYGKEADNAHVKALGLKYNIPVVFKQR